MMPSVPTTTQVRRTACNRDCPDACTILATVETGAAGERVTGIRGDPEDPVTRGFLCERTGRFLDRQYAADRITSPMARARKGGPLRPVGWDEALDLAAARLLDARGRCGPASILHYLSGGSLGILKVTSSLLFERFGPVTVKRGDICSGAGEAAQVADFGVSESHDLFDLRHSEVIVLWGKNPHVTGVHLLPVLREARARGAVLLGIDPVRTRAAELCDLFVQPRPGGDAFLAYAVSRWLHDHDAVAEEAAAWCDGLDAHRDLVRSRTVEQWAGLADVEPRVVERLAEAWSGRRPVNIQLGWGLTRRRHGSAAVRAIDALAALTGNLGVPGGGVSYYFGRRTAFDLDCVAGIDAAPRTFAEPLLGREILEARDPGVEVAWITAGNPVAMLPESGTVRTALAGVPFVVVVDTHPTDTTDLADLVLPTLTLLEDDDVLGAYGNHWLRESRPVVAAPPGCRHELEILQDLAARLGLADVLAGDPEAWKRRVTRRLAAAGAGLDALRRGPVRNPFAETVLFRAGRVATPSGRVQLVDRAPPDPAGDPDYPLTLLATSVARAQSSQWSVPRRPGPPDVTVHPRSSRGLADGARAVLRSRVAEMQVVVRNDAALRTDVALMAKGGMLRDGSCANLLVRAVETDAGGGAAYYDEPVRLEP